MDIMIFDSLKLSEFIVGFVSVLFFVFIPVVLCPLGYYFEFKGRYYREKWFELENKRREEHSEQFKSLAYRIYDFINFGKK